MRWQLFFIIIISIASCNKTKENPENHVQTFPSPRLLHVKATVVQRGVFPKQILSNGRIHAARKADLHFKTGGYLSSIKVKDGQRVYKGDVVATLENELQKARLRQAEIGVEKARKKFRELLISYNIDERNAGEQIRKALALEAGLPDAEAKLQEARAQYRQTVLRAPFGGTVAHALTSTGRLVTPSDTVAVIIDPASYEAVFPVMENEVPFLHKNLPVAVSPLDKEDETYTARIIAINPMVDAGGTVRVRARLENKHPFIEGMHTKVTVNIPLKNMLIIPKEALVIRDGKEVVFTLQNGNTVKWNYVKILHENAGRYAVSGLKEGDTVIISNNMNLTHDARVVLDSLIREP